MTTAAGSKLNAELKVGIIAMITLALVVALAWLIGFKNPFQRDFEIYVTYQFAGGIEEGSPVRVSGIKVGKVDRIDFFVPADPKAPPISLSSPGGATEDVSEKAIVPVRLKLSIRQDAAVGIRENSQFFINIAGIIGERYLEVTPGSIHLPQVKQGSVMAGVDPPRIDQLLSQSFDLAGKIKEIIDENKGDIAKSIELLYKLSNNLNKTLTWVDKSNMFKGDLGKLIENLIAITGSVRKITDKTQTPEGEKTLKLLYDLLWRLEPLDSKNIKEFLQKEGIRARIF